MEIDHIESHFDTNPVNNTQGHVETEHDRIDRECKEHPYNCKKCGKTANDCIHDYHHSLHDAHYLGDYSFKDLHLSAGKSIRELGNAFGLDKMHPEFSFRELEHEYRMPELGERFGYRALEKEFTITDFHAHDVNPADLKKEGYSAGELRGSGSVGSGGWHPPMPKSDHWKTQMPDVVVPNKLVGDLNKTADEYYDKYHKNLPDISSGYRSAEKQAGAVLNNMENKHFNSYGNDPKKEMEKIFSEGKQTGKSHQEMKTEIEKFISTKEKEGIFISNHMRDGAVDISTKGLSKDDIEKVKDIMKNNGFEWQKEQGNDHLHFNK